MPGRPHWERLGYGVHTYIYIYMYACMHACMHVCMYVCMYVYMYTCIHVCMYTSIHLYIYTYYVYMYTCIHVFCIILHHIISIYNMFETFWYHLYTFLKAKGGQARPKWGLKAAVYCPSSSLTSKNLNRDSGKFWEIWWVLDTQPLWATDPWWICSDLLRFRWKSDLIFSGYPRVSVSITWH